MPTDTKNRRQSPAEQKLFEEMEAALAAGKGVRILACIARIEAVAKPVIAANSVAMLQSVIRPSIESDLTAGPAYSMT